MSLDVTRRSVLRIGTGAIAAVASLGPWLGLAESGDKIRIGTIQD